VWAALLAAASLGMGPSAGAQYTVWQTGTGTTRLAFNRALLEGLGVSWSITREGAGSDLAPASADLAVRGTSAIKFVAPGADVGQFLGGSLAHAEGLRIARGGLSLDIAALELVARRDGLAFDVRDAQGAAWFTLPAAASFDPGQGTLEIFDASLLVAPDLAAALGLPELEGACAGSVSARLEVGELAAEVAGGERRPKLPAHPCDPPADLAGDPAVARVSALTMVEAPAGGSIGLSAAVGIRNAGEGAVPLAPGLAPLLCLSLYDLDAETPRLLGRSEPLPLRRASNSGCPCRPGTTLQPRPCEHLEPVRGFEPDLGRAALPVPTSAFESGTLCLLQASLLQRADATTTNNFASSATTPLRVAGAWLFPQSGDAPSGTVLDAWAARPPASAPAAWVRIGTGPVQVAAKAVQAGPAEYRYDYLLLCPSPSPAPTGLRVPVPDSVAVLRSSSGDEDEDPANDWTLSREGAWIAWLAPTPAADAPPHARLLTFRVVAAAPPREAGIEIVCGDGSAATVRLPAPAPEAAAAPP
jgi:hypothetical protein